jgi:hypothetical protein
VKRSHCLRLRSAIGPKPTSRSFCKMSAQPGRPDIAPAMSAFSENWSACRSRADMD